MPPDRASLDPPGHNGTSHHSTLPVPLLTESHAVSGSLLMSLTTLEAQQEPYFHQLYIHKAASIVSAMQ